MAKSYNLVGLYNFLAGSFNTQEMSRLASEMFPDLYQRFTPYMTKLQKVEVIVDFANKQNRVLELLAHIEASPHYKYNKQTQALVDKLKAPITPIPFYANAPYGLEESFYGRAQEMAVLNKWLHENDTQPLLALTGESGIGKSALAWHWQLVVRAEYTIFFQGVIWWDVHQRHSGVLEFLHNILEFFGDDPRAYGEPRQQMTRLFEHLQQKTVVLVLDGVERWLRGYAGLDSVYQNEVDEQSKVAQPTDCFHPIAAELLQGLSQLQGKSKTLLVSRIVPRELLDLDEKLRPTVQQFELGAMDEEEVFRLFSGLDIKTTWGEVSIVGEPVGYHPLTLRLLAGYVAAPSTPDELTTAVSFDASQSIAEKQQQVMALAYNDLPEIPQTLLSYLSAFRSNVDRATLKEIFETHIVNGNGKDADTGRISFTSLFRRQSKPKKSKSGKEAIGSSLRENLALLQRRGFLHWTRQKNEEGRTVTTYDLHPQVRRFAYEQFEDQLTLHNHLVDFFAAIPQPYNVRRPVDLAPTIDLYYHLIKAGRPQEAFELFQEKMEQFMESRMETYQQVLIELLEALLPDDNLPDLPDPETQSYVLNKLAYFYSLSGQPHRAIELYQRDIVIVREQGNTEELTIALGHLIEDQIKIGDFKAADENCRRCFELYEEIPVRYKRIPGHWNFGRLLAYRGDYVKSKVELGTAMGLAVAENAAQSQCVTWAYRAHMDLLEGDKDDAFTAAQKAYTIARQRRNEFDRIRAEWLMGSANLAKGLYRDAHDSLNEALRRTRAAGLVEFEPAILLAQARLARAVKNDKDAPHRLAYEALYIARRADYRLDMAEVYSFLTRLALDVGDYDNAPKWALKAREYAICDGRPHAYEAVLKEAEKLLKMLSYTL